MDTESKYVGNGLHFLRSFLRILSKWWEKKKNFPSHLCSFCVVKTCVCVHVSVSLCVSIDEYVYVYGFVFIVRVTQLSHLEREYLN